MCVFGMAPEPPEEDVEESGAVAGAGAGVGVGANQTAPGLILGGVDSDDSEGFDEYERYEGYEPLPLAPPRHSPELRRWSNSLVSPDTTDDEQNDDAEQDEEQVVSIQSPNNIPFIETVDREITREVWTTPKEEINIEMDPVKVQEVMSAMANFSLPPSSFPEWAQCISEEEWRQQLAKRINQ